MKIVVVRNRSRDCLLGTRVRVADSWWPRLRGLIGQPQPTSGQGLLIAPSQGVHMYWMKYPLDVAMLDAEGRVTALYPNLQPGSRTRMHWGSWYALELPEGTLDATLTAVGDVLEWSEADRRAAA